MLRCEEQKRKRKAHIEGEMTIYQAAALKEKISGILDDTRELEICLGNVTVIDTAGIQLLMLAKKERERRGLNLSLTKHSSAVLDAFELMGLFAYFNDPVVLTRRQGE